MDYPGEKLLTKMWETLVEKSVGGLLQPWQTRRVGKAHTDLKVNELIALAKAQVEVDRISSAPQLPLSTSSQFVRNPTLQAEPQLLSYPSFDAELISDIVASKDRTLSMRREINVSKAVLVAEEVLSQSIDDVVSESISEDWLHRWEEYAGQVSTEELQELWGRILAGEVINPGSKSLRLLEFIKTVSQPEAKLIEMLGPLYLANFIIRDHNEHLEKVGLSLSNLLQLQDLGIVSSIGSTIMEATFSSSVEDAFECAFLLGEKVMIIKHEDADARLSIPAYGITSLGEQILCLGKFVPDYEYFLLVAQEIANMKFTVEVGDFKTMDEPDGMTNSIVLTPEHSV